MITMLLYTEVLEPVQLKCEVTHNNNLSDAPYSELFLVQYFLDNHIQAIFD